MSLRNDDYLIYLFERMYTETEMALGTIVRADPEDMEAPDDSYHENGAVIAKEAGLIYGGWWKDMNAWFFHDPVTKSTIIARDLETAITKKKALRDAYYKNHDKNGKRIAVAVN